VTGAAQGAVALRSAAGGLAAPVLAVSAVSWALLAALSQSGPGLQLCVAGGDVFGGLAATLAARVALLDPRVAVAEWGLMVLAMMLPLVLPVLRLLAARSFSRARAPVLGGFLAGYLGLWMLAGLPVMALVLAAGGALDALGGGALGGRVLAPALGFGLAALWAGAGPRQSALIRAHAVPVLPARAGEAARLGVSRGGFCIASCAPAMAGAMVSGAGLAAMGLVALLLMEERRAHRPAAAPVQAVLLVAGGALSVAALTGAGG